MKNKGYVVVLIFVCVLFALSITVYGDVTSEGYSHYGLYNLKNSDLEVTGGSETVTVKSNQIQTIYEYTIINKGNSDIEAVFGIPDSGIQRFAAYANNKSVKYRTRDEAYLKRNYGVQSIKPEKKTWFLFNLYIGAGETRTIKVDLSAATTLGKDNAYTFNLMEGRGHAGVIKVSQIPFKFVIEAFKPYDLVALEGLTYEQFSDSGEISLNTDGQAGIKVRYQPVDKLLLSKLTTSTDKKIKAIAKAAAEKKYSEAAMLCEEYLKSPVDTGISLEQVKMIQAECLRLTADYDGYLSLVKGLDMTKIYPDRIALKIDYDKIQHDDSANSDAALQETINGLHPKVQGSYLGFWLENNGYVYKELSPTPVPTDDSSVQAKSGNFFSNIFKMIVQKYAEFKYKWVIYILIGFVLGFIVGRVTKRDRRSRSLYLFRD